MNRTIYTFIFTSLFIVLLGFSAVFAGKNQNTYGHAWSSNIGWISFNNCTDDPATATNCRAGSDYGVTFQLDPSSGGSGSGYAWSSNIGWISFNNQGCPEDTAAADCISPRIDWTNANSDGSHNVKGWARACSVYKAGCSGDIKDTNSTGDWDGWILLNGKAKNNDPFGVTISGSTLGGYAWGGEVLGWISFIGVKVSQDAPTLFLTATPTSVTVGGKSTLTATATGITGVCSIDQGVGTVTMTKSGSVWNMTPVTTSSLVSNTIYTISCINAKTSEKMTASATVSVTDGDPCAADPSAPGCDGSGGGGGGGDGGGGDGGGGAEPACNDKSDNDGDGLTDYPQDPGCKSLEDNDERDVKIIEF